MQDKREPVDFQFVRIGAIVGLVLILTAGAQAQTIRFLGVPNGGGQGNIGQTDPSCTVAWDTITCPSGGVTVQFAVHMDGWDDGTDRRLNANQAQLDGSSLHNGAFQILPREHIPPGDRRNGAYMVLQLCSGGTSHGIACGDPNDGPFGPGLPGVDVDECQANGGTICVPNSDFYMSCCNPVTAVSRGPSSAPPDYISYAWSSAHQTHEGPEDTGTPAYVGDLVLEVPEGASGVWTIAFTENLDVTFMNDDNSQTIEIQALLPAIIRIHGDCNNNGIDDLDEVENGIGADCNDNGVLDACESGAADDCNINGTPDFDDVFLGISLDCNDNCIPDECDIDDGLAEDCDNNDVIDSCDVASGGAIDCNGNGVPDVCDDCNNNGVPDEGDISSGTSADCNDNCVPDECDDCNNNGTADADDITAGTSLDCNANCLPDECDTDCNLNGIPDDCDIAEGSSIDSDGDGVPDECLYAPTLPGPPHDVSKSRYLSLSLQNSDVLVAMSITLPDGRQAWIGEPTLLTDRGTDAQWIADLQTSPAGDGSDQMRDWSGYIDPATGENIIHVRGCAIVPDQTYEIRARRTTINPSDPALFFTTPYPTTGTWADCVGVFDTASGKWTPPNGVTSFLDVRAVLDQFQQRGTNPVTWTDLGQVVPNYITNVADLAAVLAGFQSFDYWYVIPDHDSIADCVIPAP